MAQRRRRHGEFALAIPGALALCCACGGGVVEAHDDAAGGGHDGGSSRAGSGGGPGPGGMGGGLGSGGSGLGDKPDAAVDGGQIADASPTCDDEWYFDHQASNCQRCVPTGARVRLECSDINAAQPTYDPATRRLKITLAGLGEPIHASMEVGCFLGADENYAGYGINESVSIEGPDLVADLSRGFSWGDPWKIFVYEIDVENTCGNRYSYRPADEVGEEHEHVLVFDLSPGGGSPPQFAPRCEPADEMAPLGSR